MGDCRRHALRLRPAHEASRPARGPGARGVASMGDPLVAVGRSAFDLGDRARLCRHRAAVVRLQCSRDRRLLRGPGRPARPHGRLARVSGPDLARSRRAVLDALASARGACGGRACRDGAQTHRQRQADPRARRGASRRVRGQQQALVLLPAAAAVVGNCGWESAHRGSCRAHCQDGPACGPGGPSDSARIDHDTQREEVEHAANRPGARDALRSWLPWPGDQHRGRRGRRQRDRTGRRLLLGAGGLLRAAVDGERADLASGLSW